MIRRAKRKIFFEQTIFRANVNISVDERYQDLDARIDL